MQLLSGFSSLLRNLSKNPTLSSLSWQIFEHLQVFEL